MYLPSIDRNRCTKCYFCVNICPKDVFEIQESDVEVVNSMFCNGCEACVVECPDNAIIIREA
jgi:NAD-dependent dihydropyrimidine dehydrogenase PreA subunit